MYIVSNPVTPSCQTTIFQPHTQKYVMRQQESRFRWWDTDGCGYSKLEHSSQATSLTLKFNLMVTNVHVLGYGVNCELGV